MRRHPMDAEEYREAIERLHLSQGGAAEFLGLSLRTSNAYANGGNIRMGDAMLLRLMLKNKLKPEDVK